MIVGVLGTRNAAHFGGPRVTFHQERLADADARERQLAYWSAVMDRIEAALEA